MKNKNNKYELRLLALHKMSSKKTLADCYNSWSQEKEDAFNKCKKECVELDGYNFKIISKNIYVFSIGYYYNKDGKVMFHYETDKTYLDFEVIDKE